MATNPDPRELDAATLETMRLNVADWQARCEQYGRDCRMIGDGPDGGDENAYPTFPSMRWTDGDTVRLLAYVALLQERLGAAEAERAAYRELAPQQLLLDAGNCIARLAGFIEGVGIGLRDPEFGKSYIEQAQAVQDRLTLALAQHAADEARGGGAE